jgi:[acyl-carrier-protein] S-malonyltransferase/trans-AT polyketide synthase/acyltransferase/oxidoreductase domain-containing protein
MGRDFFDRFSVSRDAFCEASDALGVDLRALCFDEDPRLDRTEFTQPAILTTEIAMVRALRAEYGLAPTYFGGHSLGEYTALCAAGVLPLGVAARVVRRRGALMQAAAPEGAGAMIAVTSPGIGSRDVAADLRGLEVDLANRNSPDQIVLSGEARAVAGATVRLTEVLAECEHEIVPLNVSAPFHSRAMRAIEEDLRAALADASSRFVPSRADVVTSNLTGTFHGKTLDLLIDRLVAQASHAVEWIANMRALARVAGRLYEIGPHRPLRGFFRAMGHEVVSITSVRSIGKELFT